jgi:hypothetical protein
MWISWSRSFVKLWQKMQAGAQLLMSSAVSTLLLSTSSVIWMGQIFQLPRETGMSEAEMIANSMAVIVGGE